MKVTAIIAEFNPFHNGHAWLINHAKSSRGADYVIILMSGNFVQRGEPAIFDKFTRAHMALLCGADLVLELPTAFATASAREFARAAAALADKTGLVNELLFGAEAPSQPDLQAEVLLSLLQETAEKLFTEETAFQEELRKHIKAGASYPRARAAAFSRTLGNHSSSKAEAISELLSAPNSILALEYLQALKLRGSSIRPALALRQGDAYHEALPSGSPFASATALRRMLFSGKSVSAYVPDCLLPFYGMSGCETMNPSSFRTTLSTTAPPCIGPEALSLPLQHRLLSLLRGGTDFECFADVSSEIAGCLRRSAHRLCSYSSHVEELWTKQYTRSRISRALLHVLLGITKEQTEQMKQQDYIPFLRVLGFSNAAKAELLPTLKRCAKVPVVTKAAAAKELLADEIYYSDFYYALQMNKGFTAGDALEDVPMIKNELQRQIVIV